MGKIVKKQRREKNETHLKAHQKVFLCFLIVNLMSISLISALEFDNVQDYDIETRTITITNAFGLGDTIAEIKLVSPDVVVVPPGKDRLVAEFEIDNKELYSNTFNDLEFFDVNNDMIKQDREFQYKYKVEKQIEQNDYEELCSELYGNGSINCDTQIIATNLIPSYEWKTFDKNVELIEGNITLGIFTDVEAGERVEWIPTLFGERIDEWADFVGADMGEFAEPAIFSQDSIHEDQTAFQTFTIGTNSTNSSMNISGVSLWLKETGAGVHNLNVYLTGVDAGEKPSSDIYYYNTTAFTDDVDGTNSQHNITLQNHSAGGSALLLNTVGMYAIVVNSTTTPTPHPQLAFTDNTGYYLGGSKHLSNDFGVTWQGDTGDILFIVWGDFSGGATSIVTTLDTPPNNTITGNNTINFNATVETTEIDTLQNATIYIWNSTNDLFNTTTNTTLVVDTASFTVSNFKTGTHLWNVFFCGDNATATGICAFSDSNFTLEKNPANEISQTFNASVVEGSVNSFKVNITYDQGLYSIITGRLFYNNTPYTGNVITNDVGAVLTTDGITASNVETTTNIPFNWEISLTNSSLTETQNLSLQNQSVSPIDMRLCNDTFNVSFINFTIKDENTLIEMNASFEVIFSIDENEFNFSDTTGANSSYDFCIEPIDQAYLLDGTIELNEADYVTKFYTLQNLPITNVTTLYDLFMLESGNSTSFIILVRDSDYEPIEGAIVHVQRLNTGINEWLTTEILTTNFEGKSIGHLLSEDADYRFLIYLGGVLTYTSSSTKITCEATPCTVTLTLPGTSTIDFSPYEDPDDWTSTLTWDRENYIFTFTYTDTDSTFTDARLEVVRLDYGNSSIQIPACNETKITTSGIIDCDISGNSFPNGTYMASGYSSRTENINELVERILRHKIPSIADAIGVDGVLWSLFLFIGIVMLGVYRPSLGIMAAIVGVIGIWLLQLVEMTVTAVVAIIAVGVILLVEVKKE